MSDAHKMDAKAHLDRANGEPAEGYITPQDIKDVIDYIYEDINSVTASVSGLNTHDMVSNPALKRLWLVLPTLTLSRLRSLRCCRERRCWLQK